MFYHDRYFKRLSVSYQTLNTWSIYVQNTTQYPHVYISTAQSRSSLTALKLGKRLVVLNVKNYCSFNYCSLYYWFYQLKLDNIYVRCFSMEANIRFSFGGISNASLKTPTINAVWKIPDRDSIDIISRDSQQLGVKSPYPRFVIVTPALKILILRIIRATYLYVCT